MGLINFRTASRGNPQGLSITLEQAKAHCFIVPEDKTHDETLTRLILTAQDLLERDATIPYCFFKTQFEAVYTLDRGRLLLPKSPLKSVEKVETAMPMGEWAETDNYKVEFGDKFEYVELPYSRGQNEDMRARVLFTAGEESEDNIYISVKEAVANLVAEMFDNRGAATDKQMYESPIYRAITSNIRRII